MALDAETTPIVITATQGSADAFAQGSVLTGLSGRQAFNIKSIFIELTNELHGAGGVDCYWGISLSRRSKTALPTLADTDVIYKWAFSNGFTTSGNVYLPNTNTFIPQKQIAIVEETLYAQIDSTATTLTNIAVVRLEVELDTMSDIDRLNLITRSLT